MAAAATRRWVGLSTTSRAGSLAGRPADWTAFFFAAIAQDCLFLFPRILIMKQYMVVVFLLAAFANAQAPGQHTPGRIVTTTRLVAIFSQLENQWLKAVQEKDQATLDRLLGEEFQAWKPMADPIPREDWVKQAFADKLASFRTQHMAVRGLNNDISVASFVLTQTTEQGKKPTTQQYFVVDVWQKTAGGWQATDRYISQLKNASVPTAPTDVKPTGKN